MLRYVEDELEVGKVAQQAGFLHVSLSHQVMPMVRLVGRGFTACADGYLTPHIKKYVQVLIKFHQAPILKTQLGRREFIPGNKRDLAILQVLPPKVKGKLSPYPISKSFNLSCWRV